MFQNLPKSYTAYDYELYMNKLSDTWGLVVNATSQPLYPPESFDTYCIGYWIGPRAGLNGFGKISLPTGFNTRTIQAITSTYTMLVTRKIKI
jgi:hypothetical protein